MGASTDAARAEVLARRAELRGELDRLEAAGRSAVDVPARIRREPVKTAGIAAGAAFVLTGGPRRVVRGVRRVIFGPEAELPKSMLPDEVDKELRKLGTDGERVRAVVEREFAKYLDEHAEERRERDLGAVSALLLGYLAKPLTKRAGTRLAEELFRPDAPSFGEALGRIRRRRGEEE